LSYEETREQVAEANRVLAAVGLAAGAIAGHGHVSMRVPQAPDRFVMKNRGSLVDVLARARAEDMVVCDLDGFTVERAAGMTPALEVKMHSCIYKTHPEVLAIAHTHARFCAVMSVLQLPIVPMCQEGIPLVRKPLPVYPHVAPVITDAEGLALAETLGAAKAVLLEGHGATTVGATLEEVVMNMINLEEQAKMNWYAAAAAGPEHRRIPEANLDELSNIAAARQQPHLREIMDAAGARSQNGVYAYYAELGFETGGHPWTPLKGRNDGIPPAR
jgi:ribulose-5-phosphate 4-epimerase/fuculose-1-phosphate aldolase